MALYTFDTQIKREHHVELICGIDEAGRGPLAGPVFAAAVILPEGIWLEKLADSKKISEKIREKLFAEIREKCLWGIGSASEKEIDSINILQATFLAMRRAFEALREKTPREIELAIIDGNQKPGLGIAELTVVKGDAMSASVAAASILAKVSRDKHMLQIHQRMPEYRFDQHKGYGTKLHYQMIGEHGISPCHRRSFLRKIGG